MSVIIISSNRSPDRIDNKDTWRALAEINDPDNEGIGDDMPSQEGDQRLCV